MTVRSSVQRSSSGFAFNARLLGSEVNGTGMSTATAAAQSFGGGGLMKTVNVPATGVSLMYGSLASHTSGGKFMQLLLYVDDVAASTALAPTVPAGLDSATITTIASGLQDLRAQIVVPAGLLSVGSHKFEIKGIQAGADATATWFNGYLLIWGN